MRVLIPLLGVVAMTIGCSPEVTTKESGQLVHFEVNEGPVENGKHLKMTYTELERSGAFSTVAVKFASGGSVSSSLVHVRGGCLITRARNTKYFWNVGETRKDGDASIYTLEFSNSRGIHLDAFSLEDCNLMGLLQ